MQYSNLVITGSLAKDTIFNFQGLLSDSLLPDKLKNLSVSFQTNIMTKSLGGPLLNIAYSISNFNTSKVKIVGAIGQDGNDFLQFLNKTGLDTYNVILKNDMYTACGSCITDTNNNQIWGFCDGAGEVLADIDLSQICDKDTLLLLAPSNDKAMISFVNQAIKLDLDYVYDIGMHIPELSADNLTMGIENCKYLIVNEYELSQLQDKVKFEIQSFLDSNKILIITLGEKGVRYLDKTQDIFVPAYLSKCVDPVGAGDAWRGAFFGELINDKELLERLITANAMASIAVESKGGVGYLFDKIELKKRINKIKTLLT